MEYLWIVVICAALHPPVSAQQSRIVNGEVVNPAAHPYMALIETFTSGYWNGICGATIIANEWVITAAHCTENIRDVRIVVNKGLYDEARVAVSQITMHHSYNIGNGLYPNDISLLRLSANSVIEGYHIIQPARPEHGDFAGLCTIAGWGFTSGGGSASSELLQTVVRVLTKQEAEDFWNTNGLNYVHDIHMSTYNPSSGSCMSVSV